MERRAALNKAIEIAKTQLKNVRWLWSFQNNESGVLKALLGGISLGVADRRDKSKDFFSID